MKKIVRITEREITNIVSKVIKESNWFDHPGTPEYNQRQGEMDRFAAERKSSKDIGPKTEDLDGIVKILIDKGIPPSDIESIIEILYRKSENKNLAEDAKKNPNIRYEGDIKQIVDEIEEMFDNNGFHIDAELIVNNDMSPDYLDSVEEVERALEDGEIDGNGIMQMVCDFLEIKYDEKIEVESQIDIIYVYEKGNRDEGAALVIDIENEL